MKQQNNAAAAIEAKAYAAESTERTVGRSDGTAASNIGEAWLAIMSEVGYVQKQGFNKAQNYKYAGETQLIEALRPALLKHKVICTPSHATSRTEQVVVGDKKTFRTVVDYTFTYTHVPSQTHIQVAAIGEGVDTGDKAAYKAATGALKYALRQPFLIETGDEPEAHDVPERQSYGQSAFGNSAMRNKFCKETIDSFKEASTLAELDLVIKQIKETTAAMKVGCEYDVIGYNELIKQYELAKLRIEQEATAFRASGITEQLTPRQ